MLTIEYVDTDGINELINFLEICSTTNSPYYLVNHGDHADKEEAESDFLAEVGCLIGKYDYRVTWRKDRNGSRTYCVDVKGFDLARAKGILEWVRPGNQVQFVDEGAFENRVGSRVAELVTFAGAIPRKAGSAPAD